MRLNLETFYSIQINWDLQMWTVSIKYFPSIQLSTCTVSQTLFGYEDRDIDIHDRYYPRIQLSRLCLQYIESYLEQIKRLFGQCKARSGEIIVVPFPSKDTPVGTRTITDLYQMGLMRPVLEGWGPDPCKGFRGWRWTNSRLIRGR